MSGEAKPTNEERKKIKPGKLALIIVVVLIVYICVFSLVAKFVKNESIPMPLGFGAATVLTGSMEPTFHVDDLVIIAKTNDYEVGDIAVYQTGGTPTIHRIIGIDENSGIVQTKGDANDAEDTPVLKSSLKGKYLFKLPLVGFVLKYLRSVPGLIMILVLIFTLFYLSVRAKEQDAQEREKEEELKKEIIKLHMLGLDDRPDEFEEYGEKLSDTEKEIIRLKKQLGLDGSEQNSGEKPQKRTVPLNDPQGDDGTIDPKGGRTDEA